MNTEMRRTTLTQEWQMIVEPATMRRHVQLLTPESPKIFAVLDMSPGDLGPNRAYKGVEMPGGQAICFHLEPGQYLCGVSQAGLAEAGVIIEYLGTH